MTISVIIFVIITVHVDIYHVMTSRNFKDVVNYLSVNFVILLAPRFSSLWT